MPQDTRVTASADALPRPLAAPSRDTLRVLVVDDSEAIRRLLKTRIEALPLAPHAVQVRTATCGEDAVRLCQDEDFDLVLLDVMMPGMGGLEACRRIKTLRNSRIAMLSSLKTPADHAAARAMGCDNYLSKPPQDFDLQAVLRIVALRKLTASVG